MGEPERNQNPKRLVNTEKEQIAMATKITKNETLTTQPDILLLEYTAKLVDVTLKLKPAESQKNELRKQMLQQMKDNQLTEFHSTYGKIILVPEKEKVSYNTQKVDNLLELLKKSETTLQGKWIATLLKQARQSIKIRSHIAFYPQTETN